MVGDSSLCSVSQWPIVKRTRSSHLEPIHDAVGAKADVRGKAVRDGEIARSTRFECSGVRAAGGFEFADRAKFTIAPAVDQRRLHRFPRLARAFDEIHL